MGSWGATAAAATAAAPRWRVWHAVAALVLALAGAGELRLWRECAPPARALYAQHAEIALDARCDARTAKYALYLGMLDCRTAHATLAKGPALLTLECLAARQPMAAYWHLIEPLLYPSKERLVEWAMAAGGVFLLVMLVTALLPQLLALRREERLHGDLHRVVGALRSVVAQGDARHERVRHDKPPRRRLEAPRPIVVELRADAQFQQKRAPRLASSSARIEEL